MKRRDFVKNTIAATSLASVTGVAGWQTSAQAAEKDAEYYEWRNYTLPAGNDGKALHDFLRDAAIPALNRVGSRPVGAFTPRDAPAAGELASVSLLIPHAGIEAFVSMPFKLAEDEEFLRAGAPYLELPFTNPAFARCESSLMRAFAGMPKIELPAYSTAQKPRLFELRTYESHNEVSALTKIEMFNSGEIDLMRRVGLAPVFTVKR